MTKYSNNVKDKNTDNVTDKVNCLLIDNIEHKVNKTVIVIVHSEGNITDCVNVNLTE